MEMYGISVVIPLHDSGQRIPIIFSILKSVLPARPDYEIIFVNDSSQDNTQEIIDGLQQEDDCVQVLHLSRPSGQYQALLAGYKQARGRIVLTLDDDAFEEARYIPEFIEKINQGYDAVSGWRIKQGYPLFRRIGSYLFNLLISLLVKKRIHDLGSSIKAKNRKVVDEILLAGGLTGFLKHYRSYRCIEQRIPVQYSRQFPSRYSMLKLIKSGLQILKNTLF